MPLKMDDDLDDTHLCIKCKRAIVGLDNYIKHRQQSCSIPTTSAADESKKSTTSITTAAQHQHTDATPAITYEPFSFNEPEAPNPQASQGGKTSKTLGESYELPYELEADVFFSSLQLQSVQSTIGQHVSAPSGGKTGSSSHVGPLTRQKSMQLETEANAQAGVNWINTGTPNRHSGENFLKENIFKTITYERESPEVTEEEEDEEEADAEIDDDDEDYDPMTETHGAGGKWKLSIMRHSPPVVPVSHTGGKWKPEHRPDLRVAHSQLSRASPIWDENLEDADGQEDQNPPDDHTKGKWVPGTKLQRLEYKEVVELAKCSKSSPEYWCNICCRKLKSKTIYENHLKTSYHLKRAEPEQQLEKAAIKEFSKEDVKKTFAAAEFKPLSITVSMNSKKRKRRCSYLKCGICKYVTHRHLIGKHLISHYHYRRMQLHPGLSLPMIIENIHSIVLQSPFQCRPCRFYANTEDTFLLHWNSGSHLDASEGPGRFWCSYCQFECEDNNQMRRHLLGPEHKDVILAINRSVPICISKRLKIDCPKCSQTFRFNFELRQHFTNYHRDVEPMGTASDTYQSKFKCPACPEVLPSKIALQRHEKFIHSISKYFCSICNLEFNTPCQARRHRKTVEHKQKALPATQQTVEKEKIKKENPAPLEDPNLDVRPSTSKEARRQLSKLIIPPVDENYKCKDCSFATASFTEFKSHGQREHIYSQHNCILCNTNFATAQELGRHTRTCKPAVIAKPEDIKLPTQLQEIQTEQGEKLWLCDLCGFKAPFRSETLYHRVFHSYASAGRNQLLPCPLCDKTFRKQSLRFHLHNHTKETLFKCDVCSASFSRPYNLKDHIKNIHGAGKQASRKTTTNSAADAKAVKMFPCTSCDKVFKNKHSMKMHHLTHHVAESTPAKDRRLFKCAHDDCQYASVNKSLFNIHLKSHSVESFKCTKTNCNYVGKSSLHLKRHLLSHKTIVESKLFACKQCPFKAKIKGHLLRHVRQHTGEKPYSCPHCEFRSTTWENLRKHILKTDKHSGKYVFECQICKAELDESKEAAKNQSLNVFKTNSHQEYQRHLNDQHNINQ